MNDICLDILRLQRISIKHVPESVALTDFEERNSSL